MSDRVSITSVTRVESDRSDRTQDLVAVEAPLGVELRLHDHSETRSLGVLMRTPGDDRELVLGWLYGEGVIQAANDVLAIETSSVTDEAGTPAERITIQVSPAISLASMASERLFVTNSACGLCGRLAVHALDRRSMAAASPVKVPREVIAALPPALRERQTTFAETGGLHAAGFFAFDGTPLAVREDVGRHNAVDKLIGMALVEAALPASNRILVVSGRVAFEIVQKAAMAGVPIVIAVGAPTNLAVDAARSVQLTLVGFARDGRFNVYTGIERIRQ